MALAVTLENVRVALNHQQAMSFKVMNRSSAYGSELGKRIEPVHLGVLAPMVTKNSPHRNTVKFARAGELNKNQVQIRTFVLPMIDDRNVDQQISFAIIELRKANGLV